MARASAAAENAAIAAVTALIGFISLHTGDTSTTGANEYAGVTRQAVAWNTASGGVQTNSGALAFTTSGASAVGYAGGWTLVTAGVFELGFVLGSSVTAVSISIAAGALSAACT